MTDIGTRYRLVTVQDGHEHVSSVILSAEEAAESLDVEAKMHRVGGWDVVEVARASGRRVLLCERGGTSRLIGARAYSPMEDA